MSLSINHPRLLKNEAAGLDQRTVSPATTRLNSNVPPFGTTIPKVPNAPGLDNKMLTADTALSQVFGRLELIFNAIRERLSGQPLRVTSSLS
ncbi:hypothetical protein [Pseudomonas sp. MWU15-20650]|uniref:hypothetical protein n=1 Tax=Pseudomonas sp. MWU15-20650 TaxID=2933107 RepID=UPI00200D40F2|nr:hypothetical protein [Pseudomonas sp. MWU15-20650]